MYLLRLLLSTIESNKFLFPSFVIFSITSFKSEGRVIGILLASMIISLILSLSLKGLLFEMSVTTIPLVIFKFLEVISSLVKFLTVIFNFSISTSSVFFFSDFFSLNSSDDSSLPNFKFLDINFLFLQIFSSTFFLLLY